MALDATMRAAMGGVHIRMFGAVEIALPSGPARLLDGAGVVVFDGKTFVGLDPAIGVLDHVDAITDGIDQEAPTLDLTILPAGDAAITALMDPAAQGSIVTVWIGVVDSTTGQVVGEPEVCFIGELDVATRRLSQAADRVDITVNSMFERFFDGDEGVRLSDAWHQSIWPGETGLAAVTSVQRQLPWGADAPRPSAVTDVPVVAGGSGGGSAGAISGGQAISI